MSITTTTARDLQDTIVSMLKAEDYAGALPLAKQGADRFPTEILSGGFTFGTLMAGITAQLKPVNRPVSAAPVSAAPVSAAPVIPVSAPPAPETDNVITIEWHPQHGTISRGPVGSEAFAELGWGYARKLGWHYFGDRGKPVSESAESINFAMEFLTEAGFNVHTSIKGDEMPEERPEAPVTTRKRGTRKAIAGAPVSAAPVSAPARKSARKAAPVSAAPAQDGTLAAILAAIEAQGKAIAALQAAPVSAVPVSVPVVPVSAVPAVPVVDDLGSETAEDILRRVMIEIAPKRTQEAAALAWRFVVRDSANARHTAEDLRSRLNREVAGYYSDNRLGSISFMVMRAGAELTVTVRSASGEIIPSKLRAQVQGIGLTTRGIDRAATVKAAK